MRNVVQLRRVGQVSGAAGYDGSSESSSSSESMSDSNFENENVVKSTESSHVTVSSKFEEAGVLEEIEEESVHLEGINFSKAWKPFRKHHPTHSTSSTVMAMSYGRQWRSVHPMWRSLNHHRRKSSRSHEKAWWLSTLWTSVPERPVRGSQYQLGVKRSHLEALSISAWKVLGNLLTHTTSTITRQCQWCHHQPIQKPK